MDCLNIYIVIQVYSIYLIKAAQLPGKSSIRLLVELSMSSNPSFENSILLWRIVSKKTISLWFTGVFRYMVFHTCQDRFRHTTQVLLEACIQLFVSCYVHWFLCVFLIITWLFAPVLYHLRSQKKIITMSLLRLHYELRFNSIVFLSKMYPRSEDQLKIVLTTFFKSYRYWLIPYKVNWSKKATLKVHAPILIRLKITKDDDTLFNRPVQISIKVGKIKYL